MPKLASSRFAYTDQDTSGFYFYLFAKMATIAAAHRDAGALASARYFAALSRDNWSRAITALSKGDRNV